ncbi:hypothetical protein M378DRAFT_171265 [Amanita muscaria Koide BX008]|uniref:Uncharacterized protein n=1 Tax=Amanita muscaria (strain Koide BX008) TaxID=946122 RepID=A0A0C2W9D9_AMAMK|nr:hypothetical protein M378DRAFT_171265 [Amanita muscaria Koide BX008]
MNHSSSLSYRQWQAQFYSASTISFDAGQKHSHKRRDQSIQKHHRLMKQKTMDMNLLLVSVKVTPNSDPHGVTLAGFTDATSCRQNS